VSDDYDNEYEVEEEEKSTPFFRFGGEDYSFWETAKNAAVAGLFIGTSVIATQKLFKIVGDSFSSKDEDNTPSLRGESKSVQAFPSEGSNPRQGNFDKEED